MKKISIAFLTLGLLFACTTASFALMTPNVTEGRGVATGMIVTGNGINSFLIGAEYGIAGDFGVGAEIGNNTVKLDAKYQINPSIALLGGVYGTSGSANPFIGVNAGTSINKDVMLMGELDAVSAGGQFVFNFEAGAKYNLTKEFDIRGGALGNLNGGGIAFELGVGYKF